MATKEGDKARQGESTCPLGKVDTPSNKGKQEAVNKKGNKKGDTRRQGETRGDKTLGKADTPSNGEMGDTRGHKDTRGDKRTQGETRPTGRRTHPI